MALLPTAAEIIGIDNLQGLKALVGIPAAVWTAFQGQVGDPGGNIQVMASLPDFIIAQACTHATFPDGTHFNPVNATQVGLLWRASRKSIFLKNGGSEEDFVDVEPWVQPQQAQGAGTATPDPTQKSSSVKENVLKMASLLDQSDESELMPASKDKVQEWIQRYITVMGSAPEEEEEATDAQLAALYKRTVILDQAPYCDFSVWTPFGRLEPCAARSSGPLHPWATASS